MNYFRKSLLITVKFKADNSIIRIVCLINMINQCILDICSSKMKKCSVPQYSLDLVIVACIFSC